MRYIPLIAAGAIALPAAAIVLAAARKPANVRSSAPGLRPSGFSSPFPPRRVTPAPAEMPPAQDDTEPLRALALTDTALAAAKALETGPHAVVAVAAVWAGLDPAAAEQWARALPPSDLREAALNTLALEMATKDYAASVRMARLLESPARRQETLAFAAAQLAAENPEAACQELRAVEDPEEQETLSRRVLPAIAGHDPWFAADWVARRETADDISPAAVDHITITTIQRWAQLDPEAAAKWVDGFPESGLKLQARRLLPADGTPPLSPDE